MMRIIALLFVLSFISSTFAQQTFSLMNYNVENLFDTEHDEGKEDLTYLPLDIKRKSKEIMAYCKSLTSYRWKSECLKLNWDQTVLDKKIQNIARVIKSFDNGRGPDIVILEEVENLNVLTQLRDKGLADQGYQSVILIEGPDVRGIDVGMISRFPVIDSKLHKVDLNPNGNRRKETRGILEVIFEINGKAVAVLGNHWPSQGNPSSARLLVAKVMHEIAKNQSDIPVIATGDFNTLKSDSPHGLNQVILNPAMTPYFRDAQGVSNYLPYMGSHWYKGEWSYLDKILVINDSHDLIPLWDTFKVHSPDFVLTYDSRDGSYVPHRSDHFTGEGFSDHLGLVMKFKI